MKIIPEAYAWNFKPFSGSHLVTCNFTKRHLVSYRSTCFAASHKHHRHGHYIPRKTSRLILLARFSWGSGYDDERKLDYPPPQESSTRNILIIGGTGFVGQNYILEHLSKHPRDTFVSVSRRGTPVDTVLAKSGNVTWIAGDAASREFMNGVVASNGPFDACVHAAGVLLDSSSGLAALNKFMSGSGTVADQGITSYDIITRQTAFHAIELMERVVSSQTPSPSPPRVPFVFVSAAEAGWNFSAPAPWLERYLIAKRAVEARLASSPSLRAIVLRPSLVWTPSRPQALVSVVPFIVANKLGIPFVDRPVRVETLVMAAIRAINDQNTEGVLRYTEMEALAARDK